MGHWGMRGGGGSRIILDIYIYIYIFSMGRRWWPRQTGRGHIYIYTPDITHFCFPSREKHIATPNDSYERVCTLDVIINPGG